MKTYSVTSPEDLAQFLDRMAANCRIRSDTLRQKRENEAREHAFATVADIIRNAEFVGWEPKP